MIPNNHHNWPINENRQKYLKKALLPSYTIRNVMADVPLLVISEYAASERRITPSWTIFQLKTKLEPVTGIPPSCQILSLKTSAGSEKIPVEAADEDAVRLSSFPLAPYAELHVSQPLSISLAAEHAA